MATTIMIIFLFSNNYSKLVNSLGIMYSIQLALLTKCIYTNFYQRPYAYSISAWLRAGPFMLIGQKAVCMCVFPCMGVSSDVRS